MAAVPDGPSAAQPFMQTALGPQHGAEADCRRPRASEEQLREGAQVTAEELVAIDLSDYASGRLCKFRVGQILLKSFQLCAGWRRGGASMIERDNRA